MADDRRQQQSGGQQRTSAYESLKNHVRNNRLDMALWATRLLGILYAFNYFIPMFGTRNSVYYKALLANAATSALRLHQRHPRIVLSKEFFMNIYMEDSFHYLFYSIIFLYVTPVTIALLPYFLFSVLHFASYSLVLLDVIGQNSMWAARFLISLVDLYSRDMLRLAAWSEVILMPFTIVLIFMGRAGLLTPFVYYQFLLMRYKSQRNPHTKNVCYTLRVKMEDFSQKPGVPDFLRNTIRFTIDFISKLAPQEVPVQQ